MLEKKRKTWVDIYKDVDFIKNNHSKLFPTEIINRIDISYPMLKKVAAELDVELLDVTRTDKILLRSPLRKRKYTRRKKSFFRTVNKEIKYFFKWLKN
jgi:hypothetical protein